jgi:hypothetical protein
MRKPSYKEVYNIVKKHGPVSIHDIGQILSDKGGFSMEDFRCSVHSNVAGYLGCLSMYGLIRRLPHEGSGIRKTSQLPNRWITNETQPQETRS